MLNARGGEAALCPDGNDLKPSLSLNMSVWVQTETLARPGMWSCEPGAGMQPEFKGRHVSTARLRRRGLATEGRHSRSIKSGRGRPTVICDGKGGRDSRASALAERASLRFRSLDSRASADQPPAPETGRQQ